MSYNHTYTQTHIRTTGAEKTLKQDPSYDNGCASVPQLRGPDHQSSSFVEPFCGKLLAELRK